MHLDVQDLKNFYYRQSLGRAVQRVVRKEVCATGQTQRVKLWLVLICCPVTRPFLAKSRRVIALMPGHRGSCMASGCAECIGYHRRIFMAAGNGHVDRLVLFMA